MRLPNPRIPTPSAEPPPTPNSPPELLRRIAERASSYESFTPDDTESRRDILERIAQNPHCPPELLRQILSDNATRYATEKVANNPACPPDLLPGLASLGGGRHEEVRRAVAAHPRTPIGDARRASRRRIRQRAPSRRSELQPPDRPTRRARMVLGHSGVAHSGCHTVTSRAIDGSVEIRSVRTSRAATSRALAGQAAATPPAVTRRQQTRIAGRCDPLPAKLPQLGVGGPRRYR